MELSETDFMNYHRCQVDGVYNNLYCRLYIFDYVVLRSTVGDSQAAVKLYPAPAVKVFFSMDSTPSWDL